MTYKFDPSILRAYDIRGIVGATLTAADALNVGRAFGTYAARHGQKRIAIGYDGRTHSPEMVNALQEGLVSTGAIVINIGLGPSPMLYYAVKHLQMDAGVMVTGSHNPADYNGFKMLFNDRPIYGDDIQEIGKIAAVGDFVTGQGTATGEHVDDDYAARLAQDYRSTKALKIVWDVGNGATGEILQKLVKVLPGQHDILFGDIDGTFPNHHPDPTVPENLTDLQQRVAATNADIGVAFDGDGDRIGAIDGQGRIIWGDQMLALLARDILARKPGSVIIADVKASQVIFDEVVRLGGTPLMWKTGHSLIKAKMAETGAPLAGEMSGHMFFADGYYGYDDALYCAVRLLDMLAAQHKTLAELYDELPVFVNTPELRIPVDEARKFQIMADIAARVVQTDDTMQVNNVDGVRVTTPDGWWLLRASNTQAVLVARAESRTADGLERLQDLLKAQLAASQVEFATVSH